MFLSINDIFTFLLGIIGIGSLSLSNYKKKYDAINYGTKIDVDGLNMNVVFSGQQNNQTIVFLPGLGMISPYIFYKNFTTHLSQDFRVITIEPFGYGLSDVTEKERTVNNMNSELHTCIQNIGINRYYLMAHSIGGLYSLDYADKYPDEVLGFIGLDNTPNDPRIKSSISIKDKIVNEVGKSLAKNHLWRFLPESSKESQFGLNRNKFTKEELEILDIIIGYRGFTENIIQESELINDNQDAVAGKTFKCPALMFVASETSNNASFWKPAHDAMVGNPENSDVVELNGTHIIYEDQEDEIIKRIKEWIK